MNVAAGEKNNDVLRLVSCLTLLLRRRTVIIIFLAKKHAKNSCDRTFNVLNKSYHKCYARAYDQACDTLSTHEIVQVCEISDFTLRDFCFLENCFFREFPKGTISRNYMLSCSSLSHASKKQIDCRLSLRRLFRSMASVMCNKSRKIEGDKKNVFTISSV